MNDIKSLNKTKIVEWIGGAEYSTKNIEFDEEINASLLLDYPFFDYNENGEFQDVIYEFKIKFKNLHQLIKIIRDSFSNIFESGDFPHTNHDLGDLWIEGISVKKYSNNIVIYPEMGS